MTIDSFSAEYHEMKASSRNSKRWSISLSLVGLDPWPQLISHEEKPAVIFWTRKSYQHVLDSEVTQQKGVTDANVTTVAAKKKAKCPWKSTEPSEEEDLGIEGDTHKYTYLEREDGMPISVTEL